MALSQKLSIKFLNIGKLVASLAHQSSKSVHIFLAHFTTACICAFFVEVRRLIPNVLLNVVHIGRVQVLPTDRENPLAPKPRQTWPESCLRRRRQLLHLDFILIVDCRGQKVGHEVTWVGFVLESVQELSNLNCVAQMEVENLITNPVDTIIFSIVGDNLITLRRVLQPAEVEEASLICTVLLLPFNFGLETF